MRASQGSIRQSPGRPALVQAMLDAFRARDLRGRLLFTIGALVIFRMLAHVPVPGVDRSQLGALFEGTDVVAVFDLFSGGGGRNLSIVARGVDPYITSSIVMQILTPIIPRLQEVAKEGDSGRQRISQITHWLTVPVAFMSGYGQLLLFSRSGVITHSVGFGGSDGLATLTIVISFVGGTIFLVWLGD